MREDTFLNRPVTMNDRNNLLQIEEHMYNFPTNRHAFEVYKEQAMTPEYTTDPETGEQVEVKFEDLAKAIKEK